jgi:hypothetical protein
VHVKRVQPASTRGGGEGCRHGGLFVASVPRGECESGCAQTERSQQPRLARSPLQVLLHLVLRRVGSPQELVCYEPAGGQQHASGCAVVGVRWSVRATPCSKPVPLLAGDQVRACCFRAAPACRPCPRTQHAPARGGNGDAQQQAVHGHSRHDGDERVPYVVAIPLA